MAGKAGNSVARAARRGGAPHSGGPDIHPRRRGRGGARVRDQAAAARAEALRPRGARTPDAQMHHSHGLVGARPLQGGSLLGGRDQVRSSRRLLPRYRERGGAALKSKLGCGGVNRLRQVLLRLLRPRHLPVNLRSLGLQMLLLKMLLQPLLLKLLLLLLVLLLHRLLLQLLLLKHLLLLGSLLLQQLLLLLMQLLLLQLLLLLQQVLM
mmetsp:Transcript_73128/g.185208  ORF Transcript_73128/g.185208 Transcript_73128/m.185208 type:complete len:209 (-) Transcript_73128:40-666(-)